MAEEGLDVVIANGKKPNILLDILNGRDVVSTTIRASNKSISSLKKWLAHSNDFSKGEIHINRCLEDRLNDSKAVSILPIGVVGVVGHFEVDDVVKIISETGDELGIGKVSFDCDTCKSILGLQQQKPIIHYDYLYLYKN